MLLDDKDTRDNNQGGRPGPGPENQHHDDYELIREGDDFNELLEDKIVDDEVSKVDRVSDISVADMK